VNSRGAWLGVFLAAGLLAPMSAFAQTAAAAISLITRQAGTIDDSISNSATKMKTFTRGDASGVLSLYAAEGSASKLVVQLVSLESGDVTEYYFLDSKLIYVVQACENFSTGAHQGSLASCSTISEDRFYLSGGNLVAWLRGTGPGPIKMHEVPAGRGKVAAKLEEITLSASTWMAFAESPLRDFDRFAAERRAGD